MTPSSISPSVKIKPKGKVYDGDRQRAYLRLRNNQAAWDEWKKANPHGRANGQGHKMTRVESAKRWAEARTKAQEFMKMIDETFDPSVEVPETDEGKAAAALYETCVMALGPTGNRDKLDALKTVLAYTKEKPVAKTENKISGAEDWLRAAVEASKK